MDLNLLLLSVAGIARTGRLHATLRVVSQPWRGYGRLRPRPMTAVDAAGAVGASTVGVIVALRVARVLLFGSGSK